MDEAGHVVVADGKPVYMHDDGREAPFDAGHTLATIARLNGEANELGHRRATRHSVQTQRGAGRLSGRHPYQS